MQYGVKNKPYGLVLYIFLQTGPSSHLSNSADWQWISMTFEIFLSGLIKNELSSECVRYIALCEEYRDEMERLNGELDIERRLFDR